MRVEKGLSCSVIVLAALAIGAGGGPEKGALWQPTHPADPVEEYVGPTACAQCHSGQPEKQTISEMGLSVTRAADARILKQHPELTFARGPFTYTLSRSDGRPTVSVTDGKTTITEPIMLVVGSGTVFQAYLIQHAGQYYRIPVDYFAAQGKLGLDTEASSAVPANLDAAVGKTLSEADVRGCMRCHSPASVVTEHSGGERLDFSTLQPGIHCEVCHGPGAKHLAAMEGGDTNTTAIFNPAHATPQQQAELCNQCHTSAAAMKQQHPQGVRSIVSPAYRFESSRCFNASDPRSTCTFCHEPHAPMVRDSAAYDNKCLACHTSGGAVVSASHPGKSCPTGQRDCAGCHMPRFNIPNNPILFTDHRIRIAAAGAAFPE